MRSMSLAGQLISAHLLLCCVVSLGACGPSSAGDPNTAANAGKLAAIEHPGRPPAASEIAQALRSSDAQWSVLLLQDLHCLPDENDAVREVRQAWIERDSFTPNQAMHDELVRTYVAKCLVTASQVVATDTDVKNSAIAQLRTALKSPNPRDAEVSLMAIAIVATPEDIQNMAAIALHRPELAISAAASLSRTCGPEAAAAVKQVVANYAGDSLSERINSAVEAGRRSRVLSCPSGTEEEKLRSEILKAGAQATQPTAAQVREALAAPTAKIAAKSLLLLQCRVATDDAIDTLLGAWRDRDSPQAPAVTRDPLVRAIMAHCVLSSDARPTTSAADRTAASQLLRSAIGSEDAMTVVVAMQGLADTSLQSDAMTIAKVPRRMPALRNPAAWAVSSSCAPDPEAALAELRQSAATTKQRETVDKIFKEFEMGRKDSCRQLEEARR
jgi:hypothetical protein